MKKEVMLLAWQFVKKNSLSLSEALKKAWINIKVKLMLQTRACIRFTFLKVDGAVREAFGTLNPKYTPDLTGSANQKNDSIQTYFDVEREEWRCFKRINLIG